MGLTSQVSAAASSAQPALHRQECGHADMPCRSQGGAKVYIAQLWTGQLSKVRQDGFMPAGSAAAADPHHSKCFCKPAMPLLILPG
jgi:hypothetical protein